MDYSLKDYFNRQNSLATPAISVCFIKIDLPIGFQRACLLLKKLVADLSEDYALLK
jgi:hypothetical protein